jgi:hypothetical protein
LGRAVVEDHCDNLRLAADLHIGPTFAQSLPLGGADADLIYDRTLVDLKSTSQARVVGREEVWQLVGYLLADTDDAFRITHVSFAALRRRRTTVWAAADLVGRLADGHASPIPQLRADFAAMLTPLSRLHNIARSQSLRALVRGE